MRSRRSTPGGLRPRAPGPGGGKSRSPKSLFSPEDLARARAVVSPLFDRYKTDPEGAAQRLVDHFENLIERMDVPVAHALETTFGKRVPVDPLLAARHHNVLGVYRLYHWDDKAARRRANQGLQLLRRLPTSQREQPETQFVSGQSYRLRGDVSGRLRDFAGARADYARAIRALETASRSRLVGARAEQLLGATFIRVGELCLRSCDDPGGAAAFGRAVMAFSEATRRNPGLLSAYTDKTAALFELAEIQLRLNGADDALRSYGEGMRALAEAEAYGGAIGRLVHIRARLQALHGRTLAEKSEWERSSEEFRQSFRSFDEAFRLLHGSPTIRANQGRAMALAAEGFWLREDSVQALEFVRSAQERLNWAIGRAPTEVQFVVWSAGTAMLEARLLAEAGFEADAIDVVRSAKKSMGRGAVLRRGDIRHDKIRIDAVTDLAGLEVRSGRVSRGTSRAVSTALALIAQRLRGSPSDFQWRSRRAHLGLVAARLIAGSIPDGAGLEEAEKESAVLLDARPADPYAWAFDGEVQLELVRIEGAAGRDKDAETRLKSLSDRMKKWERIASRHPALHRLRGSRTLVEGELGAGHGKGQRPEPKVAVVPDVLDRLDLPTWAMRDALRTI